MIDGLSAAIADAAQEIDIECLSASLGIISSAQRIHVSEMDVDLAGNGTDLSNQLLRLGSSSSYHALPEEQRMVVTTAGHGSALIVLSAEPTTTDAIELFELIGLQELPAILIAPKLPTGIEFPGVRLEIGASLSRGLFARSSRCFKQSVIVELLCTGSSLELGHGISEGRGVSIVQTSPPKKC